MDLVLVGKDVASHRDGDLEGGAGLTLQSLGDRHLEDIQRHLTVLRLLVGEGDHAVGFPGPVSVVEDLNLDHGRLIRGEPEHFLRLALENGAGLFPALLALTALLLILLLGADRSHLFAKLFSIELAVSITGKVAHELLHHVLPWHAIFTTTVIIAFELAHHLTNNFVGSAAYFGL